MTPLDKCWIYFYLTRFFHQLGENKPLEESQTNCMLVPKTYMCDVKVSERPLHLIGFPMD